MEKIEKVWLTDSSVWIRTESGKEACEKFSDYPRLRFATKEQRERFVVDEDGVHWDEIDEDLSFDGFFNKPETTDLYKLFMAHPELNVSALARRLRIAQSLMAQYISGAKRPSAERKQLIYSEIRKIGKELLEVGLYPSDDESDKMMVAEATADE